VHYKFGVVPSGAQVRSIGAEEGTRYQFVRELGRGSMGSVWLAYDRVRRQKVAVKRVLPSSPTGLLRLKREFRVVAPIRHRNLVRFYELWSDEGGPFFTMEFIEGHDLRCLLLDKFPSLSGSERIRYARDVAAQLLPALVLLHGQGVIHRDLKPSNLMLGIDGVLKLVDFGLLVALDEERAFGLDRRGAGTPPYMAPEQARGEPATPASDMYSLGVLLFEMAVGRFPREGEANDLRGGASSRARPALDETEPELPKGFATLCAALLQRDHRLRPDAPSALAALTGRPTVVAVYRPAASDRGPGSALGRDDPKRWVARLLTRVGDGSFGAAVLEGVSSSGKSAILRWTSMSVRQSGGLVLLGRGRPEEHLDFNAIDAAIDTLAEVLLETPLDADLANDVALASAAFPVLAGRRAPSAGGIRLRAFDALIRILASLAGAAGVYLLVDDLHWADARSLAFLDRLIERSPPAVGLLATVRSGADGQAAQAWLAARPSLARLKLAPSVDAPSRFAEVSLPGRRRRSANSSRAALALSGT
jgi:eukaryotic-like serine/threonine-protein kinase